MILQLLASIALTYGKEISFSDGYILFEVPDDYTALSQSEMDIKYPSKQGPRMAVGNDTRAISIAYDLQETEIPAEAMVEKELPNAQQYFTQVYNRLIPGIQWVENKIIKQAGIKWMYFEMTSRGIDTDIHNIVLMSFYENKLLIFNFNSTQTLFENNKETLLNSIASIKIRKRVEQSVPGYPPQSVGSPEP